MTPKSSFPNIDFKKLEQSLLTAKSKKELYNRIANAPFEQTAEAAFLFLGFISFLLLNKKTKCISAAAVSDTELYNHSISGYNFDPSKYQVSIEENKDNAFVKVIMSGKALVVTDWGSLSRKKTEINLARLNQANSGIAYNEIHPLDILDGGVLLYCYYQYPEDIGDTQRNFMDRYTKLVTKALNSKL